METESLDILSREELFKRLKAKSKTSSSVNIWIIITVLIVVALACFGLNKSGNNVIPYIIFFILIACVAGWDILDNYRFKKKIDSIDTPDQLLDCWKKRKRCTVILVLLQIIIIIALSLVVDGNWNYWGISTLVVAAGIYYFLNKGSFLSGREMKIIEQLQELVDSKE